jgi:hypothetical protein
LLFDERDQARLEARELANAWRAAHLKDICQTTLTIRMDFESFDDFWAPYLSRQGPAADYVASLDAARQTTLRHQGLFGW